MSKQNVCQAQTQHNNLKSLLQKICSSIIFPLSWQHHVHHFSVGKVYCRLSRVLNASERNCSLGTKNTNGFGKYKEKQQNYYWMTLGYCSDLFLFYAFKPTSVLALTKMGVLAPLTVDTIMEIQAPTKMTAPNHSGCGDIDGGRRGSGVDDTSSSSSSVVGEAADDENIIKLSAVSPPATPPKLLLLLLALLLNKAVANSVVVARLLLLETAEGRALLLLLVVVVVSM